MKKIILYLSTILMATPAFASSQGPSSEEQYEVYQNINCESASAKTPDTKVEFTFNLFMWSGTDYYQNQDIYARVNGVVHDLNRSEASRTLVRGKIYPQYSKTAPKTVIISGKIEAMNDQEHITVKPVENSYTKFADGSVAFRATFTNMHTEKRDMLVCTSDEELYIPDWL